MYRTSRTSLVALLCASLLLFGACGSEGDGASSSDTTVASLELSRTPDTGATDDSDDGPTGDATTTTTDSTTGDDAEPTELSGSYCEMAAQAEDQTYSFDLDPADPVEALAEVKEGFARSVENGKVLRAAAPSEIVADIDAILEALEQANPRVQAATSMDEVMQAFSSALDDDFMIHATNIGAYDQDECGIEPDSEPSPSDD